MWHSISFGDAVLPVASLPVSPLAVLAAVRHKTTTRTCGKFGSIRTPFGRKAVATGLAIGSCAFLVFIVGHVRECHGSGRQADYAGGLEV